MHFTRCCRRVFAKVAEEPQFLPQKSKSGIDRAAAEFTSQNEAWLRFEGSELN